MAFLRVATDPKRRPVFVHCKHGADRTGMMVAFYRIVVQGWSKKDAIREMRRGGYDFHPIWGHLIRFIKKADIETLKRALGLQGGPETLAFRRKPLGGPKDRKVEAREDAELFIGARMGSTRRGKE